MGGCRCSFRSCRVRTDGKTHMFHFPVYDKLRCHQWILNAQRYEFFNLTVSQVRNRVVCQHHFTNDCFMNYKKEKLTFEAIPTENGPYCDSNNDEIKSDIAEAYSFLENVIENESFYIDKKANSSIKYVDFLTKIHAPPGNTDLWETENVIFFPPKVLPKDEKVCDKQIQSFQSFIKNNKTTLSIQKDVESNNSEKEKKNLNLSEKQNNVTGNNIEKDKNNTNSELNVTLFQDEPPFYVHSRNLNLTDSYTTNTTEKINEQNLNSNKEHNATLTKNESTRKDSKIKIISQQTVTKPLPLVGKFESVKPSLILQMPQRLKEEKLKEEMAMLEASSKPQVLHIEIMSNTPEEAENPTKSEITSNDISCITGVSNENEKYEIATDTKFPSHNSHHFNLQVTKTADDCKEVVGKSSILKSKIAPERVAAIERKRNFNKKLRDVVESCLQKPVQKPCTILKVKDTENVSCNEQSQLHKQTRTSARKDKKTTADLEARLEKMESMLAKKIEQNSERISELKNSFKEQKATYSVYTQTLSNEESYKKYLYNEISQFLTPSSRSIIYEELFINKFVHKASECEPKLKKRRRR